MKKIQQAQLALQPRPRPEFSCGLVMNLGYLANKHLRIIPQRQRGDRMSTTGLSLMSASTQGCDNVARVHPAWRQANGWVYGVLRTRLLRARTGRGATETR